MLLSKRNLLTGAALAAALAAGYGLATFRAAPTHCPPWCGSIMMTPAPTARPAHCCFRN